MSMFLIAWEELELYGNRDLLSREYEARHGGRLSEKKARQISACIAQSQQYSKAATNVGLIAKPLLVYYSVLALSKAVILFRDKTASEESLQPGHGLVTKNWSSTLGGTMANVRDLTLELSGGTFDELLNVTGNLERFACTPHAHMSRAGITHALTPRLPLGTSISFGDLLSRIPELAYLYEKVFGHPSETCPCSTSGEGGDIPYELIVFSCTNLNPSHTRQDFAGLLGIDPQDDLRGTVEVWHSGSDAVVSAKIKLGSDLGESVRIMPPSVKNIGMAHHGTMSGFFRWPVDGAYYPSTLAVLFMLSYSLGMLSRYFPSVWMSGISSEKETAAFPLLTKVVDHIQFAIPIAIRAEFTNL